MVKGPIKFHYKIKENGPKQLAVYIKKNGEFNTYLMNN